MRADTCAECGKEPLVEKMANGWVVGCANLLCFNKAISLGTTKDEAVERWNASQAPGRNPNGR